MNPTPATTAADTGLAEIEQFAGRLVGDLAAAWTVVSAHIGDRLGLYRALAEGPGTSSDISARTGCHERLVAEWLDGQVAAGIVASSDRRDSPRRYHLPDAHAAVLAIETSPAFLGSAGGVLAAVVRAEDVIVDAFRSDGAVPWGRQHHCLFGAVDRFYSISYRNSLAQEWIPALTRAEHDLRDGGRVADVGCGRGTALMLLAQAYPAASFVGVDNHRDSLDRAGQRLAAAGIGPRVRLEEADAGSYGGGPYNLICFFDSLHDLGDPSAAIAHARTQLAPTGSVLLVEPQTEETLAARIGSLPARLYYPGSAFLCTPNAIAQGGHGLGNQVPESTWRELFVRGGFPIFRRIGDTPVNRVFEARTQPDLTTHPQ
jgi:SAM-dependent methyltransferase